MVRWLIADYQDSQSVQHPHQAIQEEVVKLRSAAGNRCRQRQGASWLKRKITMTNNTPNRTEISTLGEFGLIDRIKQKFSLTQTSSVVGIGDDAAVIDCR